MLMVIFGWVSRLDGQRDGWRREFWFGSWGRGEGIILKWALRRKVVKV